MTGSCNGMLYLELSPQSGLVWFWCRLGLLFLQVLFNPGAPSSGDQMKQKPSQTWPCPLLSDPGSQMLWLAQEERYRLALPASPGLETWRFQKLFQLDEPQTISDTSSTEERCGHPFIPEKALHLYQISKSTRLATGISLHVRGTSSGLLWLQSYTRYLHFGAPNVYFLEWLNTDAVIHLSSTYIIW